MECQWFDQPGSATSLPEQSLREPRSGPWKGVSCLREVLGSPDYYGALVWPPCKHKAAMRVLGCFWQDVPTAETGRRAAKKRSLGPQASSHSWQPRCPPKTIWVFVKIVVLFWVFSIMRPSTLHKSHSLCTANEGDRWPLFPRLQEGVFERRAWVRSLACCRAMSSKGSREFPQARDLCQATLQCSSVFLGFVTVLWLGYLSQSRQWHCIGTFE